MGCVTDVLRAKYKVTIIEAGPACQDVGSVMEFPKQRLKLFRRAPESGEAPPAAVEDQADPVRVFCVKNGKKEVRVHFGR